MLHEVQTGAHARGGATQPWAARADLFDALDEAAGSDAALPRLLLVGDIDDFRSFNTRHGYAAGDELLRQLGARLGAVAPSFRLGSDSFAVLLEGDALQLTRDLARLLEALTIQFPEVLHCSFGCVALPGEAHGPAAFALAEERLEDQRRRGLIVADRVAEVLLVVMGAHDESLREHSTEVARLSEAVAARLGLGVAERALVRRTAELHDIGKLAVRRSILDKAGTLDEAEWEQIRLHTLVGEELLSLHPALATAAALVRATHEWYDGSGYPDGAREEAIPLAARIVAACDAYHAMLSDRPYAPARSNADALAELEGSAGTQFDPAVVAAIATEVSHQGLIVPETIADPSEDTSLHSLTRLHALLESATVVEDPEDLPRALDAVARVIGETLGYAGVVVNLYRHEWDDFVVSTVYGEDPALRKLLGSTYDWSMWERILQPTYLRGGAYTVYAGEYDWREQSGHRIVPDIGNSGEPDAWQSEDEIFIPFHHTDGHILGILNVALPRSGRRPSEDELRLLATVVRHAARAVQRAQQMAADAAHRRALESLLRVSSKLTQTSSGTSVLSAISAGISEALGFERVVVYLHDRETDALVAAAAAGFEIEDPRLRLPFGLTELQRLFDDRYDVEGCYLVPLEDAEAQIPTVDGVYQSTANGRGPWAWARHWLVVPLLDRTGSCLGVVLADDPVDRLLPSTERLQALRLFANQATFALESVAQYEAQRYLAEHDALTNLRNRHSLMRELDATLNDSRRSKQHVALVYCDLDGFKQLNDACGHAVGDAALIRFGRVLANSIRAGDSAFRIGGDEFAMLLRGCNEDEACRVVHRALLAWKTQPSEDAAMTLLDASFGIAIGGPETDDSIEDLLRRADEAMYEAKRSQSGLRIAA